ncbi:RteC domain-containing protein [Lutibacter sp.]|uniref:RteC domain-containing protein n=1 Tax=Lutibacter sp. TaxID=1925666 RepID=UPI001A276334|nr:RteC domain-containing protein [Lutibacter sp.]MBI9040219.1 RteC domain-containing protein [Lutibacter sp.]
MNKLCVKIVKDLEKELKHIEIENDDILITSEKCITKIRQALKETRKIVLTNEFKSKSDEIEFFKIIKPRLVSKFIYYAKIFKVISKVPKGNVKVQKKYLENELRVMQTYFNDHLLFYHYYQKNGHHSDELFFLRKNKNINIQFDFEESYSDDEFTTNLDTTFSKFKAFEKAIIYFNAEIVKLDSNQNNNSYYLNNKKSNLTWTAKKVYLVELIYALFGTKAINNGQIEIKEIAETFEIMFNIKLGDYYRTFQEIKRRKLSNTKFLRQLSANLEKQIAESEK